MEGLQKMVGHMSNQGHHILPLSTNVHSCRFRGMAATDRGEIVADIFGEDIFAAIDPHPPGHTRKKVLAELQKP